MVLSKGAENISQGQRQLLTIARAILADPEIMILDEATSNVDAHTEQAIQDAMAVLMKGRTSFVIAHRLSTIRDANVILYMENGDLNTPAAYRSGGFLLPRCSLFPATCRRRQRLLAPQAFSVRTVPALPVFIF